MKYKRTSGILLHPTSLPGPFGIGDLGPNTHIWLDFLSQSGCQLWQILPLGPTGYGDSPYQCFSAFAGNHYLISPEALFSDGLLSETEMVDHPDFPEDKVDFGNVIAWKLTMLKRAYSNFQNLASAELKQAYEEFRHGQASWLDDYGLFMALKEAHNGASWTTWEEALRDRQPQALADARQKYWEGIEQHIFGQFIFFRQWHAVRAHAGDLGIKIIGDIPIFVAHDSADVWSHPELFYLNEIGQPKVVAGVPPDYFSPTGQLWGNPLYRWNIHKSNDYHWWIERIRSVLNLVDIVRLDHFRGFAGYWRVSGKAKTAEKGRWVRGPGNDFFRVVQKSLGDLPVIAEDLGVITPDVEALRIRYNLPGMKILQFSFASGPKDPFLPHNYPKNCVVYTGTHDNDTARGWYERVPEYEREFYRHYLDRDGSKVAWDLIRASWASVAVMALAPFQDFLDLGNEARMNYPGNPSGNWTWRVPAGAINSELQQKIRELNYLYDRLGN
jgi:4-alpha-glucanotransferase